jgi:shikimate kinase
MMVEILGPAGAGKTTLASSLCQRNGRITVAEIPGARTFRNAPFFINNGLELLPIFLRQPANGRKLTWREIKMMIHANGWYELLYQQALSGNDVILLDHGPVYRVVGLSEFGPQITKSNSFMDWREKTLAIWATHLDLVVSLDAPNFVLAGRINNRASRHIVKGKSQQEISDFLTRFRTSYEEAILYFAMLDDAPRVLHFDTHKEDQSQITESVLHALNNISRTRTNRL